MKLDLKAWGNGKVKIELSIEAEVVLEEEKLIGDVKCCKELLPLAKVNDQNYGVQKNRDFMI